MDSAGGVGSVSDYRAQAGRGFRSNVAAAHHDLDLDQRVQAKGGASFCFQRFHLGGTPARALQWIAVAEAPLSFLPGELAGLFAGRNGCTIRSNSAFSSSVGWSFTDLMADPVHR